MTGTTLRTAIQHSLVGVCLLGAGASALPAQEVALELVPSATTLSGCAEEELEITLRLINPATLAIGGYQVFLRFPAEQFGVVGYDDLFASENTYVQAPPPLGEGFRDCTRSSDDPWDDGMGSDVISVVVSLVRGAGGAPVAAPEVDLGRFVFRSTGASSAPEGVVFRGNDSVCHPPFDQTTKVFSRTGETIPVSSSIAATVVVNESDRQLTFFRCEDRGTRVELSWGFPAADGVAGVRLFRNGEMLANILLTSLTSFTDEAPLSGESEYEAAILLEGELEREGCRLRCSTAFRFIRGDANGNGGINLTDSVAILGHLFQGRPLECPDAGDFNDTGTVNLTDAVATLEYLFRPGGIAPPPPFPEPGVDPTPDGLVCD